MNNPPLVTVVALCYNHSRYVVETLESIQQQDYKNLQVIVIDDCSTDNSTTIIEQWLNKYQADWLFIKHAKNQGVTKSLNESILLSKGKYYKPIACDDILTQEFISHMTGRFEKLTADYGLIYSDVKTINEHSEEIGKTPFTERGWDKEDELPEGKIFNQLAGWCFIPAPGTFFKTSVLRELPFDEKLLVEDWDMWLQISKKYLIKGIVPAMVKYRIHSASTYQQKSPAYRDHELRIAVKHLGYSKVADKKFNDFIYHNSILLYMYNGNRPLYWMWKRFVIKKNFSNLMHVFLVLLGIRYDQKERWKKRFQQIR